jgi:hypothetical protein
MKLPPNQYLINYSHPLPMLLPLQKASNLYLLKYGFVWLLNTLIYFWSWALAYMCPLETTFMRGIRYNEYHGEMDSLLVTADKKTGVSITAA